MPAAARAYALLGAASELHGGRPRAAASGMVTQRGATSSLTESRPGPLPAAGAAAVTGCAKKIDSFAGVSGIIFDMSVPVIPPPELRSLATMFDEPAYRDRWTGRALQK